MRSEAPTDWTETTVGEVADNHDRLRVPLSSLARSQRQGAYPYWGANGVLDHVDDFIFEGPHVLIAEDGTVERGDGRAVVHWVDGQFWVNNHAHILTASDETNQRWLYYALTNTRITPFLTGSVQLKLTQKNLRQISLLAPPPAEQQRIAWVLGSLDDKIENNRRVAQTLEQIAAALFKARFVHFIDDADLVESELGLVPRGWEVSLLREVTGLLTRGRAPVYADDDGVLVLNQKCVRDQRISFKPARRHNEDARSSHDRRLQVGDALVNSTGVGTLGRTAQVRWLPDQATVDGHVTLVRADENRVLQDYLAISLMQRQDELERMGHGSTGQTELTRARLGELRIVVPPLEAQRAFVDIYVPLREKMAALEQQNAKLVELRDRLLPRVVSGQIRVSDHEDPGAEPA